MHDDSDVHSVHEALQAVQTPLLANVPTGHATTQNEFER